MPDAAHHARLVANADLLHVDANAETCSKIAHQVAEIDALIGFEIENCLIAIEKELNRNRVHVRCFFGGELAKHRKSLTASLLKLGGAGFVFVGRQALHRLQRRFQAGNLRLRALEHVVIDMTELKAASRQNHHGVVGRKRQVARVEPKGFWIICKSNRRYANHTVPLLSQETTRRCTSQKIHYSRARYRTPILHQTHG